MSGPPDEAELPPPPTPVECTTSRAAPIVDTIVGGLQVVRTGVAIGADDSVYADAVIKREADIALGIAFTALFVSSAVYGYSTASGCDAAKRRQLERASELYPTVPPPGYGSWGAPQPQPQPYAPPPSPPPSVQPQPYAPPDPPPSAQQPHAPPLTPSPTAPPSGSPAPGGTTSPPSPPPPPPPPPGPEQAPHGP